MPKGEVQMKLKKFKMGNPFQSMCEFVDWIEAGKWVFWCGMPQHPHVIANMFYSTLQNAVRNESIKKAEQNQIEKELENGSADTEFAAKIQN